MLLSQPLWAVLAHLDAGVIQERANSVLVLQVSMYPVKLLASSNFAVMHWPVLLHVYFSYRFFSVTHNIQNNEHKDTLTYFAICEGLCCQLLAHGINRLDKICMQRKAHPKFAIDTLKGKFKKADSVCRICKNNGPE